MSNSTGWLFRHECSLFVTEVSDFIVIYSLYPRASNKVIVYLGYSAASGSAYWNTNVNFSGSLRPKGRYW